MPEDTARPLFLAVPGTQETRQLDLASVRDAVARGEIGLDNWAWWPERNEWVPLAQLPEFAVPSEPEPVRIVKVEPRGVVAAQAPIQSAVPIAASATVAVVTAPVAVAAARGIAVNAHAPSVGGRVPHAATYYSKPVEEHREFPFFKILFFVLGVVIVAMVVVNYFLVDQPFTQAMSKTPFAQVRTFAHLGAFVQPNVLLIHVLPSQEITSDNFADLLTSLTRSAPRQAIAGRPFDTISLTTEWLGQYAITADDWEGFSDMGGFTPDEKREFVLTHLEYITGQPIFKDRRNATPAEHKADEEKVWDALVAHFRGA